MNEFHLKCIKLSYTCMCMYNSSTLFYFTRRPEDPVLDPHSSKINSVLRWRAWAASERASGTCQWRRGSLLAGLLGAYTSEHLTKIFASDLMSCCIMSKLGRGDIKPAWSLLCHSTVAAAATAALALSVLWISHMVLSNTQTWYHEMWLYIIKIT